jgi:hypothetical protein
LSCPLCHQRKPKRFCPAEGETICAVCCGTYREVRIDCPSDCPHLLAARRYEMEHRQPLSPDDLPYPSTRVSSDLIEQHQPVIVLIGQAVLEAARETRATDEDVVAALAAMAETYRTLQSGIYYEHAPEGPVARDIYTSVTKAVADFKQAQTERTGFSSLKDSEVFGLLVFLLRVGKQEFNGRPRSRAFLDFLRSWIPAGKEQREPSRIITA